MTVVARLVVNERPMLVGDLLLSGEAVPWPTGAIPTLDDPSSIFDPRADCVIRGLRQKIAILDDNLVLGWSGDRQTATKVIADMRSLAAQQRFSYQSLAEHLDCVDPSVWDQISLAGHCVSGDRTASFARGRGHELSVPQIDNIVLLGSGATAVAKTLEKVPLPTNADRALNPAEASAVFGLTIAGVLINDELGTRSTLRDFFGGGYEIAVLDYSTFRKLDNVTYLFWFANVEGHKLHLDSAPRWAFRYAYDGDLLIIRAIAAKPGAAGRPSHQSRVFKIPPIYRALTPEEDASSPWPDLNAAFLCNYFLVQMPGRPLATYASIRHQPKPEDRRWVTFEDRDEETVVGINSNFILNVAKEIARATGIGPPPG